MALKKKKVTWNSGQVPERTTQPRMPVYIPEPEIKDDDLRNSWNSAYIGQMCIVVNSMFSKPHQQDSMYPHPILYNGDSGWGWEMSIVPGQTVVYLGVTHVPCRASKGRVINKPYTTVFFDGMKFLVADTNNLKPISE